MNLVLVAFLRAAVFATGMESADSSSSQCIFVVFSKECIWLMFALGFKLGNAVECVSAMRKVEYEVYHL